MSGLGGDCFQIGDAHVLDYSSATVASESTPESDMETFARPQCRARRALRDMLRFMSRRFAGSAKEVLEMQGNLAQQAQHVLES
jgi:hypothetical protein